MKTQYNEAGAELRKGQQNAREMSRLTSLPRGLFWLASIMLLGLFSARVGAAVLPTNVTLYAATFGNGIFVSVGARGAIFSSVNGGPWEQRVSGTTNRLEAVAFGGGLFLAAAANGALFSSPDGVTWFSQTVSVVQRAPQIAYGNGRFVVAGKGGPGQWLMLVSSNAVNWTTVTQDAPGPSSVPEGLPMGTMAFGAGKFVAAGGVAGGAKLFLTSTDGLTWKERGADGTAPTSTSYGGMIHGNGSFGVIENYYDVDDDDSGYYDRLLLSEDGENWTSGHLFSWTDWTALAAGDCIWMLSANQTPYISQIYIASRENYFNWQALAVTNIDPINALAFGNGKFFAFGSDIVEVPVPPVSSLIAITPTNQQVSLSIYSGVYFSASGSCLSPPVYYQWRHNGTNIPGQTNLTLYISPLSIDDTGDYTLIATNVLGQLENSELAHLTVVNPPNAPPVIGYPTSRITNSPPMGYDTSLGVAVSGWPTPAYQWRLNGTDIIGATNVSLPLYNVSSAANGVYRLYASNAFGTALSSDIVLEVLNNPPYFSQLPNVAYTVREGARLDFVSPYQYYFYPYWLGGTELHVFRNNAPYRLPLATDSSVVINQATLADAGEFRFMLSNAFGVSTALVANVSVIPAEPLDRWTQRNPLPQNQTLFDVALGNGAFVAVGDRGAITRSVNTMDWTGLRTTGESTLSGVAFGNALFAAVGGGNIYSSTNGSNWTLRVVRFDLFLASVIFANGRFVAVGGDSIVTSTDGITWRDATLPSTVPRNLRSVAFGNNTFVAVGDGRSSSSIWTSPDGTNWTAVASASADELEAVTFGNNLFVTVGNEGVIYTSPNGTSWTARDSTIGSRLLGVTYGAGRFIAVGSRGRMVSSINGSSWSKETSGTPDRLESVRALGPFLIAVGENGTTLTSLNGTAWTKRSHGSTRDLDGMAQGNGMIVIVGKGGTILTSSNGTQYVEQNSGVTNDLHGVGYANGLFVAAGEPEIILTSSNAVNWQVRHTNGVSSLKSVRGGSGSWIAVGTQGTILSSTDGVTWTPRFSTTCNDLNGVVYGEGLYVVVGDNLPPNGTMLTSPDGVTWTRRPQFIGKNLRSVSYANKTFVATANDEVLIVSSNALQWATAATGLYPGYGLNLRGATFGADTWVLVGNVGTVLSSTNAVDWTRHSSPTMENLHAITFLNNRFVTMGNRGTVLQTGPAAPQPSLSIQRRGFGLDIGVHGSAGVSYELQMTDAVGHPWTPIQSFTLDKSNTNVVDSGSVSNAQRLYRLVIP